MKSFSHRAIFSKRFLLAALICLLLVFPLVADSPYLSHVMVIIYINSSVAVGLWLLVQTRIFNLGHAGFVAIGAYACALSMMRIGLPFYLALFVGGLASALVALLIGAPILKVKGISFLILSFAFGEVVRLAIVNWPMIFGGASGLRVPRVDPLTIPGLGTLDLSSKTVFYYFSLVIAALTFLFVYRVFRCRIGLTFRCVGEDEDYAETIGINSLRCKVLALTISCFLAGISGGVFALYYNFLSPELFTVWQSIYYFVYLVVGGAYSIIGPIVGAFVFIIIGEIVRPTKELQPVIYACMVLFGIFFFPRGFVDIPRIIQSRLVKFKEIKGA